MKSANRVWFAASIVIAATVPAAAEAQTACTVTFRMATAVTAASLQFEVEYARPGIEFAGSGTSVSCYNLAPALPSITDDDSGPIGVLYAAYIAPGGFPGPQNLFVCDFETFQEPYLTDFGVTVVDAMDADYQLISPLPEIVPSAVDCGGVFDTTTTTSTTVTTTTSTLPWSPMECTLEFSLSDAVTLGSLQWDVDYTDAPGEIAGTGGGVQCQRQVLSAFASMQDDDANRRLTTAFISLAGFSGPTALTRCTFLADEYPAVEDFTITVVDASSPDLVPIVPTPAVVLSSVFCTSDTTTTTSTTTSTSTTTLPSYCGDGFVDPGEECDDGPDNSNAVEGGCRLDCLLDRLCGDGDGNGVVNVVDAQWVLQAAIQLVEPCPLTACDTNNDATVTVSDAQRILFRSVGLIPELTCALPIALRVDEPVTLASVIFEVAYGATQESFLGEGGSVVCDPLIEGLIATFDNDAVSESLSISVSRPGGFTGPVNLAECMFRAVSSKPDLDDFSISVGGATAPGGSIVPPPALTLEF